MYVRLGQSQFGNGKNIYIYFAFAFKRLCLGTTRVGDKKRKTDKLLPTHAHRHMDMCLGQFQKIY